MNDTESSAGDMRTAPAPLPALRIWPAILLIALMVVTRALPKILNLREPKVFTVSFLGPVVCGILLLLAWWAASSRASWKDRLNGVGGVIVLAVGAGYLVDRSMLPISFIMHVVPWGVAAFGIGVMFGSLASFRRPVWIGLLASALVFGFWTSVRSNGVDGDFQVERSWRWEPTAEERFLEDLASRATTQPTTEMAADADVSAVLASQWPGFRGPHRDNVVPSVVLATDWSSQPPRELWRHPIGPGWSSFAVAGNRLYTQEQRGEDEAVTCYDADTGDEIWAFEYPSRFWESIAGAGPRATPTLQNGMLFAMGAEGILVRLDPITGEEVWRRDIRTDADRKPPMWGFSSSPLVVDSCVMVHAGGDEGRGVLAYDVESGDLIWTAESGDHTYSSPQLAEFFGRTYALVVANDGLSALDPADGTVAWTHPWEYEGYRVVQPLVFDATSILIGTGMEDGTRRIDVTVNGDQCDTTERWTSRSMKPNYNDYVAHDGFLYGFDHNIFACVDLETGERQWKKGRYGNGQVLLLPDAGQLLVISEKGELVLLKTNPEKLEVLARHQVLDGKTWNHPVLVGDRVYVRNAEEAAAYQMPVSESVTE